MLGFLNNTQNHKYNKSHFLTRKYLMENYLIIYEKSKTGYSAYVPDLQGCTSAGETREEIEINIIEAIKLHLELMKKEGLKIPIPLTKQSNL